MKSFSFAKALTLGCLVCLALPIACGDDDDSTPTPKPSGSGGEGGESYGPSPSAGDKGSAEGGAAPLPAGISSTPKTVECKSSCTSAKVGLGTVAYYIDPCCAGADNACGVDTAFLAQTGAKFDQACQAKDQPGEIDAACPSPDPAVIPAMGTMLKLDAFPGCCRADTGRCGVSINAVTAGGGLLALGNLGLGCIDAAPFFPGETPKSCGAGGSGAGGGSSVGGAGGAASISAGGAGGAGGNP